MYNKERLKKERIKKSDMPWGKSDYSEEYAGIVYYSTVESWPAGYKSSAIKLNDSIPVKWKLSGRFEGWYEEDCGWTPFSWRYS